MERISISNIEVGYDKEIIIKDLSLNIPNNKIISIIGANGCGKSTLLKGISRILPISKGNVILDGKNIKNYDTKDLAKIIGMLPQKPGEVDGLTVEELVGYGRFPHRSRFKRQTDKDKEVVKWAMEVTGVLEQKDKLASRLSGGQLQRVWIAMAIAQETDIIFLDEPTTYLDIAHQLDILELLDYLNKKENRTIIMVLHEINQASRFSDYIIGMKNGDIVKIGTPEEVITKDVLIDIYNINAYIGEDPLTNKPICLTYTSL
ncbi:MAG: ABC transporter ATP-binding protein [Lachnospirales bacterium]